MGLIIKEYAVTGNRRGDTVRVLYDTGAGASFVRRDIAEPLGDIVNTPSRVQFMTANAEETLTVDQVAILDVEVDGTQLGYTFYVAEDLAEELIIGADMMQKFKISLDLDSESVSIDPRSLYLRA